MYALWSRNLLIWRSGPLGPPPTPPVSRFSHAPWSRSQGCASWAQNPKGPHVTPFCHQMGRHPTIWDFKTGFRLRIPARISPWGSRGPNPNFFFAYFGPQNAKKCNFLWGFHFLSRPIAMDLGPRGPKGAHGALWGPTGPRGAGAPRGPLGP